MKTEHAIDWKKSAQEIQDDYEMVCKQCDDLLAVLKKLKRCKSIWNMFPSSSRKSYGSMIDDAIASVEELV